MTMWTIDLVLFIFGESALFHAMVLGQWRHHRLDCSSHPLKRPSQLLPKIMEELAKHMSQQGAVNNGASGVPVFSKTNHAWLLHQSWRWEIQKMGPMWDIQCESILVNKALEPFHIIFHTTPLGRAQIRPLAPIIGCHGNGFHPDLVISFVEHHARLLLTVWNIKLWLETNQFRVVHRLSSTHHVCGIKIIHILAVVGGRG